MGSANLCFLINHARLSQFSTPCHSSLKGDQILEGSKPSLLNGIPYTETEKEGTSLCSEKTCSAHSLPWFVRDDKLPPFNVNLLEEELCPATELMSFMGSRRIQIHEFATQHSQGKAQQESGQILQHPKPMPPAPPDCCKVDTSFPTHPKYFAACATKLVQREVILPQCPKIHRCLHHHQSLQNGNILPHSPKIPCRLHDQAAA
ncbi:hypothetical protein DUNSADRAFT_5107 [Dunaliella salina]|uniref:Encoded protein n=1 Tax=Dunaliella salina TaxID=3046 RepID=A0ABQ7HAI8_DUNSA|nr:hypothetical protein DUNSADRAFT_5107 [Dunaliella salina]|eukprot:KAF5843869.1 hypothetical protein DUNSADRAFT_5107 [Dunaliella salina]